MMSHRDRPDRHHPIFRVHRVGALAVALVLWAFAILGYLGHVGFFATQGVHVLGLSSNGLLSTVSVVVGAILAVAAALGGPVASTTCAVVGGLFLLSGLANLIVLDGPANYLAFTMPNVVFSLVVGLLLLSIGLYGRASGQLPADNPYRQAHGGDNRLSRIWHDEDLTQDQDVDEAAARRRLAEVDDMAEAEHAVADGRATPEQDRKVMAAARQRALESRRVAWRRANTGDTSLRTKDSGR
jgi:hypothetical protein